MPELGEMPALPKFKAGEAPERNASAMVVLMVNDVSALPAKGKARIIRRLRRSMNCISWCLILLFVFNVSFVRGCYRKKERPRPIGLAAKFE